MATSMAAVAMPADIEEAVTQDGYNAYAYGNGSASDPYADTGLNVCTGAGTNYSIITVLRKRDKVKISDDENDWLKFSLEDGKFRWFCAVLLSVIKFLCIFSKLPHILSKEVDKMREDDKRQQIFRILARGIRTVLEEEHLQFNDLQEIRLRIGKPLMIVYKNTERVLPKEAIEKHLVTKDELRETLDYISHYSLYAYESEIRQGFITIEGGHRVGMTGKVILEKERVKNMQYISSVNIRVAHEVIGCGNHVLPYLTKNKEICHTLIISPPRCGKTTLIRDLIRQISNGNTYVKGCTVGVVDERSELGGCHMGIAQNDMGMRTDILDCCPKAEGMILLIRSMAPRVLAVDEIGGEEEIRAIEYAMQCGCKLLASVHGTDLDEIREKPGLDRLVGQKRFERYVVLDNQKDPGGVQAIYDEWGNVLCRDL